MSQMVNNELKQYSDIILKSLNSLTNLVEKKINSLLENATDAEKEKIIKDLENSNFSENVNKIKKNDL